MVVFSGLTGYIFILKKQFPDCRLPALSFKYSNFFVNLFDIYYVYLYIYFYKVLYT